MTTASSWPAARKSRTTDQVSSATRAHQAILRACKAANTRNAG